MVYLTSDGGFLLTRFGRPTPFLADARGVVVRAIGRSGAGPGEFRMPRFMFETPAGYHFADQGLGRLSHVSKDLQPAGETRLPAPVRSFPVPLDENTFVISADVPTRAAAGRPVHIISRDGSIKRSIGPLTGQPGTSGPRWAVALARDSTLLIANANAYRIERWDTAGIMLGTYERRTEWFPPDGGSSAPAIRQIYEDPAGLLWVHIDVSPSTRTGTTVIEVLDIKNLKVLASVRSGAWPGDAAGGGFYMKNYREATDGSPRIDVWGFRLVR